jgi:flagellar hook-associated protein 2
VSSSVATISGIYSGIDWKATIDALMQIESRRVTILENRQTTQQQRLSAWQNINSRLATFQTAMDEMQDLDSFLVHSASSSNQDVLTATAGSGAANGSYSILVNQLATSSRLIHQGWADAYSTAVNSSGADQSFSYTYGTGAEQETITLTVGNGATLGDLVDLINNDDNNPGVQATVLNDGSGSATAYHLVLTTEETGSSTELAINDAATTLGASGNEFLSATIEQTQVGQNAQIRVDGYPAASWIESQSNLIEDVITGITIELANDSAGEEIQMTVSSDKSAVKEKIEAFVSSYNEIISLINTYSSYDAENESMGILLGDSGLSQLERSLNQIVNRPLTGLSASMPFTTMGEIGIRSGSGGLLTIESDDLDAALEDNFKQLGELFTFSSRTDNSHIDYFTHTDGVPAGDIAVSAVYNAAGELISATLNGEAADVSGAFIVAAEGTSLEGLRLRFTDPGDGGGTLNATVTLGFGVAAAFQKTLSELTDSESGLVQFQTNRLEDGLENLAQQIEEMNDRLDRMREQYEREYLAMETAISRLQSQSAALSSLGS